MAKTAQCSMENQLGCGIMGGIFNLRGYMSRKTLVPALPAKPSKPQRRRSVESVLPLPDSSLPPPKPDLKPTRRPELAPAGARNSTSHQKSNPMRPSDASRSSTSSSSSSSTNEKKLHKESSGNHAEHLNNSKDRVRSSSGNVILKGSNLGNLKQLGTSSLLLEAASTNPKPRNGFSKVHTNGVMGNIIRQPGDEYRHYPNLASKLDPEGLKNMGNEAYKQGRFGEALALYEQAISLDPKNAVYWGNKSAALVCLGKLLEAAVGCEEAILLDPNYQKAHVRLAAIYHRLGEAEKALYHYNYTGESANPKETARAQALHEHLRKCTVARKGNEWSSLLKETHSALCSGADSAPQIFALQTEALLNLQRHQEACEVYSKGPDFAIESCTKLFGLATSSYLLMIRAQVFLVTGRFEDAVTAAQNAARLDPGNKEVSLMVKRTRAVSSARISGNLLFRASKYAEACIVYNEGLEYDPCNSVLLCNRAACRSKLGQFEKAIEDCTAALVVQPSYGKPRLRRADCNAKLERWEAAIQDYEMLIRETPGDEEVAKALFEAQVQLKRHQGEDVEDMKFGSNLVLISSNERFRHFVTSPGMSVVLFCNKAKHMQVVQLMEQVCKRFPSVNFLKVEVEDHPYLAKSEGVSSIPAFKIYKNGSRVKEIPGNNRDLLEKSVKLYSG
ncbi:hypothetical protein SLEP1_g51269 [Rubroshorea leprosula]|uniref:Thioredoxin domain-containing protein n=1 Tax=Rubroshorea leprosula TaxID=152421 RepID=A0AAV5M687_9ROSI|nr:hypothetical protein SLEP1_g51269 [Rubroshorea leprosula]